MKHSNRMSVVTTCIVVVLNSVHIGFMYGSVHESFDDVEYRVKNIHHAVHEVNTAARSLKETVLFSIEKAAKELKRTIDQLDEDADTLRTSCDIGIDLKKLIDLNQTIVKNTHIIENNIDITVKIPPPLLNKLRDLAKKLKTVVGHIERLERDITAVTDKAEANVSMFDDIEDTLDYVQSIATSVLDKTCDAVTLFEALLSDIDTLANSSDSALDKTCDTITAVDDILSNIDAAQTIADSVLVRINIVSESVGGVAACAPIPVPSPMTITDQGTFCLIQNIEGTIAINSPSIVLDLNGFIVNNIIVRPATSTMNNITIRNGIISNPSGIGLDVEGTVNVKIYNIDFVNGLRGISITNSQAIAIDGCTFSGLIETPLLLQNCIAGHVSNSKFFGNALSRGGLISIVQLITVRDFLFDSLKIVENSTTGLVPELAAISQASCARLLFKDITIARNTASNGNFQGVRVEGGRDIVFKQVTIASNVAFGVFFNVGNFDGVLVDGRSVICDECTVYGNNSSASINGINLQQFSTGHCIINTRISNNTATASNTGICVSSENTTLKGNSIEANSGNPMLGIEIDGSAFFINLIKNIVALNIDTSGDQVFGLSNDSDLSAIFTNLLVQNEYDADDNDPIPLITYNPATGMFVGTPRKFDNVFVN